MGSCTTEKEPSGTHNHVKQALLVPLLLAVDFRATHFSRMLYSEPDAQTFAIRVTAQVGRNVTFVHFMPQCKDRVTRARGCWDHVAA